MRNAPGTRVVAFARGSTAAANGTKPVEVPLRAIVILALPPLPSPSGEGETVPDNWRIGCEDRQFALRTSAECAIVVSSPRGRGPLRAREKRGRARFEIKISPDQTRGSPAYSAAALARAAGVESSDRFRSSLENCVWAGRATCLCCTALATPRSSRREEALTEFDRKV